MVCILAAALTVMSCTYATFQSPEVNRPGRVTVGVGGAGGITFLGADGGGYPTFETDLYARVGVLPDVDVGLRLALPLGIMGDVKYQVLHRPVLMSLALGAQYFDQEGTLFGDPIDATYLNLYPMILVGTRHLHAGVKAIVVNKTDHTAGDALSTRIYPGVLLGASIGSRFRVMPELDFLFGPSGIKDTPRLITCGGLGLQYTF